MTRHAGLILALLLAGAAPLHAADNAGVRIEKVLVGYDGFYRAAHMVPVFVQVRNNLQAPFQGELQATQSDDDGDRIRWRAEAAIRPGGSETRMILICPRREGVETIRIDLVETTAPDRPVSSCRLDMRDAESLKMLQVQPRPVGSERRVVGVIGDGAGLMGVLTGAAPGSSSATCTSEPAQVVSIPLQQFPPTWQALDMIDVLYWEAVRPAELDLAQQKALAQWVWRGGQLVVGLSGASQGLVGSDGELARLLPVEVLDASRSAPDLHGLGSALLGPLYRDQLSGPVPAAAVRPRAGALPWTNPYFRHSPLLYRWARGAGGVTVIRTSLTRDTLERLTPALQATMLARLTGFSVMVSPNAPAGPGYMTLPVTNSFSQFLDEGSGILATLAGVAVLMLLAYGLIAGPGTWLFAQYRKKRHHSWWLFAGVVAAATLASLMFSVVSIQGSRITAATVLDLPANSSHGVLRGYLGVYVPAHRKAAVEVLGDNDARLTPMIQPDVGALAKYPDVHEYDVRQESSARITPYVRRTLKQLALDWRGDAGGVVRQEAPLQIRFDAERGEWEIAGTLRNDLPADLIDPVLIYLPPGIVRSMTKSDQMRQVGDSDARWCRCVQLGTLVKGRTVSFDTAQSGESRPVGRLQALQRNAAGTMSPFSAVTGGRFWDRVVLLSTLSLYDQPDGASALSTDQRCVRREALGRLERSDQVRAGKVLLLAQAKDLMPADVRVDGRAVPTGGTTVVRVVLDAQVLDAIPTRDAPIRE